VSQAPAGPLVAIGGSAISWVGVAMGEMAVVIFGCAVAVAGLVLALRNYRAVKRKYGQ